MLSPRFTPPEVFLAPAISSLNAFLTVNSKLFAVLRIVEYMLIFLLRILNRFMAVAHLDCVVWSHLRHIKYGVSIVWLDNKGDNLNVPVYSLTMPLYKLSYVPCFVRWYIYNYQCTHARAFNNTVTTALKLPFSVQRGLRGCSTIQATRTIQVSRLWGYCLSLGTRSILLFSSRSSVQTTFCGSQLAKQSSTGEGMVNRLV